MKLAELSGEKVIALPGKGSYVGKYAQIRWLLSDSAALKCVFPISLIRLFALIELFFLLLFQKEDRYIVHSVVYSIPLYLSRKNYSVVIHGSDRRYLHRSIFKPFLGAANKVLGVGFGGDFDQIKVEKIPNIFETLPAAEIDFELKYDVVFILRPAPVKNPQYPYDFFRSLEEKHRVKIAVFGLDESFLTKEQLDELATKTKYGADNSIEYLGVCPFEKVVDVLLSSHTLIIPSQSEGIAKAMLEALSGGLRVLISEKLNIPAEFENQVQRLDLYDWDQVTTTVIKNRISDRNVAGINFVNSYRKKSLEYLIEIYRST